MRYSLDFKESGIHAQKAPTKERLSQIVHLLKYKYPILDLRQFVALTGSVPYVLIHKGLYSAKSIENLINSDPELSSYIKQSGLESISVTDDGGGLYDLKSTLYSKGLTIQKLIESLGVSKDLFFNIGNHTNDIPLSQVVGTSYAVANASQDYKAVAHKVCVKEEAAGALEAVMDFLKTKVQVDEALLQEVLMETKDQVDKEFENLKA